MTKTLPEPLNHQTHMQNITDQTHETPLALEVVSKAELLQISRAPDVVLAEAQKAAKALQGVINAKPRKVVLNGEQYLEFEDWQTLGRFYGVTSKVEWSKPILFGDDTKGFEARAVAISTSGQELSAADSMCLNDEPNWRNKPLFMLRSMAETRACAKALRNVLGWVSVLAGFKPTPYEEVSDTMQQTKAPATPADKAPQSHVEQSKAPSHPSTLDAVTLVGCKAIPFTAKTGKNAGKTSEFYAATFRDGLGNEGEANTFDKKIADACEVLTGRRVLIEVRPGKRPGKLELVSIEPARDDDEIPFEDIAP